MYVLLGTKGMLGSDVKQALIDHNIEFVAYDHPEIDVTKIETMEDKIVQGVDVVINCTAYTAVDLAESNEETCRAINAIGPKNIATLCKKVGAKLVHVSTDFVFSGDKKGAYVETDTPNPCSVYGKTKQEGEEYVMEIMDKYFILRTAYLFGINGNNFIETMIKLSDKELLTVIDDQVGSPTNTKDLAEAIVLVSQTDDYGIYHATSEGQASWYEFAKYVFEKMNLEVNLQPCSTEEYPTPAKRPHNSVLENTHFKQNGVYTFPDWHIAVDKYLELRNER